MDNPRPLPTGFEYAKSGRLFGVKVKGKPGKPTNYEKFWADRDAGIPLPPVVTAKRTYQTVAIKKESSRLISNKLEWQHLMEFEFPSVATEEPRRQKLVKETAEPTSSLEVRNFMINNLSTVNHPSYKIPAISILYDPVSEDVKLNKVVKWVKSTQHLLNLSTSNANTAILKNKKMHNFNHVDWLSSFSTDVMSCIQLQLDKDPETGAPRPIQLEELLNDNDSAILPTFKKRIGSLTEGPLIHLPTQQLLSDRDTVTKFLQPSSFPFSNTYKIKDGDIKYGKAFDLLEILVKDINSIIPNRDLTMRTVEVELVNADIKSSNPYSVSTFFPFSILSQSNTEEGIKVAKDFYKTKGKRVTSKFICTAIQSETDKLFQLLFGYRPTKSILIYNVKKFKGFLKQDKAPPELLQQISVFQQFLENFLGEKGSWLEQNSWKFMDGTQSVPIFNQEQIGVDSGILVIVFYEQFVNRKDVQEKNELHLYKFRMDLIRKRVYNDVKQFQLTNPGEQEQTSTPQSTSKAGSYFSYLSNQMVPYPSKIILGVADNKTVEMDFDFTQEDIFEKVTDFCERNGINACGDVNVPGLELSNRVTVQDFTSMEQGTWFQGEVMDSSGFIMIKHVKKDTPRHPVFFSTTITQMMVLNKGNIAPDTIAGKDSMILVKQVKLGSPAVMFINYYAFYDDPSEAPVANHWGAVIFNPRSKHSFFSIPSKNIHV